MNADQIRSLRPAMEQFTEQFRLYFKRKPTFRHFRCYLLGLMAQLRRKSIEPIALAAGVPVRTLQEFLAFFAWDHQRLDDALQRMVAEEHANDEAIGIIDASAHTKYGNKTPGVQRQWCGEKGKVDNCIVGQHLLYTNNAADNPFGCVLASDLFLPESWSDDRPRCREAGIPENLVHRQKWRIALKQIERAIGNGVRFSWLTFDEDYGQIPPFWFELDRLGQRAVGEVRPNFRCWARRPRYRSLRQEYAASRVDDLCRHSPVFTSECWRRVQVKNRTRSPLVWDVKAARVHLVDASDPDHNISWPTDRLYWLIIVRVPGTKEMRYYVSNASSKTRLVDILRAACSRYHVEQWFRRAKQEAGFGAFEVRTYTSLIRHWLCSRLVMLFLSQQTCRLRGEKSGHHVGAGGGGGRPHGSKDVGAGPLVGPTDTPLLSISPAA